MNKFTGRERLEYVKEYKASGLSEKEFSALKGMSSTILGDWNNAFEIHFGGSKISCFKFSFMIENANCKIPQCIIILDLIKIDIILLVYQIFSNNRNIFKIANAKFKQTIIIKFYLDTLIPLNVSIN